VFLTSADGGVLTLIWSRWNGSTAYATGRSQPDHGTFTVRVTLSRPRQGTFTRMFIETRSAGKWYVNRLMLAFDDLGLHAWLRPSWVANPGCGCRPAP
jgi:hypothetical protein